MTYKERLEKVIIDEEKFKTVKKCAQDLKENPQTPFSHAMVDELLSSAAECKAYNKTVQFLLNILDNIAPSSEVEKLIEDLEVPKEIVKIIFVNGKREKISYQLKNHDRLGIFPAIGGG